MFRLYRSMLVCFICLCLVLALSACTNPGSKTSPPTANPGAGTPAAKPPAARPAPAGPGFKETASFEVEGDLWAASPRQSISPDGKYALGVTTTPQGMKMLAFGLADGNPIVLHSADRPWATSRYFGYNPIGWVSATRALFAIRGSQVSGPNKGKNGVAIVEAGLSGQTASSREVAFVPLSQASLISATLVPARKKVLIHVTWAIWEYDTEKRSIRLVKGDLPDYDRHMGEFFPRMSPDGSLFVYDRWEKVTPGIHMLDVKTGQQKTLVPAGETMSFGPTWSPDGRYIAAYTISKSKTPKSPGLPYDILYGEEGPQSAGHAITVFGVDGKVIQRIGVEGKMVTSLRWSQGSTHLAFGAGKVHEEAGHMVEVQVDSVWVVALGESPSKVADVDPEDDQHFVYTAVLAVDNDGLGVICNQFRQQSISLRHLRVGLSNPEVQRVEGELLGWTLEHATDRPSVGIIESREGSGVWCFEPSKWSNIARFPTWHHTTLIGFTSDLLAVGNTPLHNPEELKPGVPVPKTVIKVFAWK